jgi:ParB family transcriptional regulator, chromosome partitioning protein
MKRQVLGKGLEALIPKREPQPETKGYSFIDIEKLVPSPYQSRTDIPEKELKDLTYSIQKQGVIQPLIVRKRGEKFEIIAGSRRYYAAKSLGHKELPTIARDLGDEEALVFSMIENLQRQDLNPLEEAEGFKRLTQEFMLSHEQISKAVGKDRTTVVNSLRLLKLPDEIQAALRQRRIRASQARTLLAFENQKEQLEMFDRLMKKNMTVRSLEQEAQRRKNKNFDKADPFIREAENNLQKILGRKVKIISSGKKGKCVIEYYSFEDLEQLTNILERVRI